MIVSFDNKSKESLSRVAALIGNILDRDIDFLLANTVKGCAFKFPEVGVIISMFPVSKEHPASEIAFLVNDIERKKGTDQ